MESARRVAGAHKRVEPTGLNGVATRERSWAGGSRARRQTPTHGTNSAAALTTLLVFGATAAGAGESVCEQMRTWPAPRPLYARPDRQLLHVEKRQRSAVRPEDQHRPSAGPFYFAMEPGNHIRLSTGTGDDVLLSVPEYADRPLEARWINVKPLYLEVWFNPHSGAYWVYDVESQTVLVNELQNDGRDAWAQCHSGQDPLPGSQP